jgi:hypothetical protein
VLAAGLFRAAVGTAIGAACTLGLSRLAWTSIVGLAEFDLVNLVALVVTVGACSRHRILVSGARATRFDPVQSPREAATAFSRTLHGSGEPGA